MVKGGTALSTREPAAIWAPVPTGMLPRTWRAEDRCFFRWYWFYDSMIGCMQVKAGVLPGVASVGVGLGLSWVAGG